MIHHHRRRRRRCHHHHQKRAILYRWNHRQLFVNDWLTPRVCCKHPQSSPAAYQTRDNLSRSLSARQSSLSLHLSRRPGAYQSDFVEEKSVWNFHWNHQRSHRNTNLRSDHGFWSCVQLTEHNDILGIVNEQFLVCPTCQDSSPRVTHTARTDRKRRSNQVCVK